MHFEFSQGLGKAKDAVVARVSSGLNYVNRLSAQGASSVKETVKIGLCSLHAGLESLAKKGLETITNLQLKDEMSEVEICDESDCSVCQDLKSNSSISMCPSEGPRKEGGNFEVDPQLLALVEENKNDIFLDEVISRLS